MKNPDREQQEQVNAYFLSTLDYWDAIYRETGVYQTITSGAEPLPFLW